MGTNPADSTRIGLATADLMTSLALRRGAIDWLDWLPLAKLATADPASLVAAFVTLATDPQYDLIERLRAPEAGPIAAAVLLTLAEQAGGIVDEQVRQFVLEDAVGGWTRIGEAVEAIRRQTEPLAARLAGMKGRLDEGFDLGAERVRLERELAELRVREAGQDERFGKVHDLEQEILRLQTRARILGAWDEAARTRLKDELKAEVEALGARKTAMESRIGELTGERDRLRKAVAVVEAEAAGVAQEVEVLERRRAEAEAGIVRNRDAIEAARRDEVRQAAELREVSEQADRMQAQSRETQARLQAERARMQELEASAHRAGLDEIERKVREVYAMLPPDQTSGMF